MLLVHDVVAINTIVSVITSARCTVRVPHKVGVEMAAVDRLSTQPDVPPSGLAHVPSVSVE